MTASGWGRERGRAIGDELGPVIRRGVEQWKQALAERIGQDPDDHLQRLVATTGFLVASRRLTPDLVDEVTGTAEAAGLSFRDLFAYQLADEEWWWAESSASSRGDVVAGACTALALQGAAAAPVLAQNMDLPLHFDGTQVVLRVQSPGRPEQVLLTSAGYLGFTGCNSAGVGVCVNTLLQLRPSPAGLPVAFMVRKALESWALPEALMTLMTTPHASGQNYLVGDPGNVVDLECSADGAREIPVPHGGFCHTNHPLAASPAPTPSPEAGPVSNSQQRWGYCQGQLSRTRSAADLESLLADRTVPVSVLPTAGRKVKTFGAVSFVLSVPPVLRIAAGPPSDVAWHDVNVDTADPRPLASSWSAP
ncbi:MAG: isopenicillin-N N-acyltransferase like protein [Actinomycetota bacterium]|jgi:hypothetical protein|nr:isopenicillin-N N-acyltransferase like protein [Actinomycetota bacterium]